MLNHSITAKRTIAPYSLFSFLAVVLGLFSLAGCITPIPRHSFQAQAYYQQGFKYEAGMGVPKNIEEARKWYQLSAQLGNPSAQIGLARLNGVSAQSKATQNTLAAGTTSQNVNFPYVQAPEFSQKQEGPRAEKSFSSASQADAVSDLVEKKMTEYGSRNDVVMVIFEAKKDVNSALANIKTAMRTPDPAAILNPYWIIGFGDEKTSMETNCGVIIGKWYAQGFPYRAQWEKIMYRALQEETKSGTYLYTLQGEFRINGEHSKPDIDALKKNCFKGSKLAQHNFNSPVLAGIGTSTERNDAANLNAIGAILFFGGQFAAEDKARAEEEKAQWEQMRRRQQIEQNRQERR